MSKVNEITAQFYDLEYSELRTLQERLRGVVKSKRDDQALKMKKKLSTGDRVELFGLSSGNGETGVIRKVNRTRAVIAIDQKNGREYNVPLTCLKLID